jgi:hypothetical protein
MASLPLGFEASIFWFFISSLYASLVTITFHLYCASCFIYIPNSLLFAGWIRKV